MVVDFHVHHYPQRYMEALLAPDSGLETYRREDGRPVFRWFGGVTLTVPQPMPEASLRLTLMDELGIDKQVLSIPSPNAYFLTGKRAAALAREVNEELAGFRRDHPGRFESMAMLPLRDPELALEELDRALADLDMVGTMILTHVAGTPLDDPRFDMFWSVANDLRLLVHVHPTGPAAVGLMADFALTIAVGFQADTTLAAARLAFAGVFERYPDIRWVFSHLGGTLPFILPRLDSYYQQFPECRERAPKPPSVYLRKALYDTVSTHVPALRCACDTFGADRLVFGSDYPHVPGGPEPFLRAFEALELPEPERDQVLGSRAERLLDGKAD